MSTSTNTPAIYLFFKGQCSEAMSWYAEVLDWEQLSIVRNRDAPTPQDRMEGDDDTVMNVVMRAGDALVAERFTMFTDRFGTPWMLNFEGDKAQTPSAGGA